MKKFIKGIFGLFLIKLTVIGFLLIYQACTTNDDLPDDIHDQNFLKELSNFQQDFSNIKVFDREMIMKLNSNTKSIDSIYSEVELIITDSLTHVDIRDFQDLIDQMNDGVIIVKPGSEDSSSDDSSCVGEEGNELCLVVYIENTSIQQIMDPAIQAAKQYLYSYGLNDADIIEALDGEDESYLVPIVQATISADDESETMGINSNDLFNLALGVHPVHAQNWGKIGACAKKAFGLDILDDLKGWKNLKRKARKKLIKKLAYTAAAKVGGGLIGAALIVVEFGLCMA